MSQKTLRIATIANQLILTERIREAGILQDIWNKITSKKPKLKKEITDEAIKLAKYLHNNNKIEHIEKKLNIYRNIDSVTNALKALIEEIGEIEDKDKLDQIQGFIDLIEETKTILDKKERDILGKNLAQVLLSNKLVASVVIGTTESLDEDDNSVSDGVTSHPLEDHAEEETD